MITSQEKNKLEKPLKNSTYLEITKDMAGPPDPKQC